ncbi:MAG: adenylate cyclase [Butyrivibrio sp.]|nr:adenylate cyclase [Butyrivibrio sp.]
MEIEKKFTVSRLSEKLENYPFHIIEQGYLNVHPAIRVRKEDDQYYMTYKGHGTVAHEEYNLALDEASYRHLLEKADGSVIRKKRYLIPLNADAYTAEYLEKNPELAEQISAGQIKIELDIFEAPFAGKTVAEVEFPTEEAAEAYHQADWFKAEVTGEKEYSNAYMSSIK